jgi:hypothetical protein
MSRNVPIPEGSKFYRLTVTGMHHIDTRWRRHYTCICDCGNTKVVQSSLLKSGNTRSCGCLAIEAKSIHRLPNDQGVINHLILQYKRHARNRGHVFELSKDSFTEMIKQPCHYCGLPPSNNKVTKNCSGFLYSGIDRVNSDIGYVDGNAVPCCVTCNYAKRDLSTHDFLMWVNRVYTHNAMAQQWGYVESSPTSLLGTFPAGTVPNNEGDV